MKHGLKIYQGVDLISSKTDRATNNSGAWFSRLTLGIDSLGFKYILNIYRQQNMSFRDQVAAIKDGYKKFQPELIVVEDNQSQTWICQELKNTTDLPIMSFTTTAKKKDLEEGIPSLALEFENGKMVLPYGDPKTRELVDIFADELTSYPFGVTSDILMSFYLCMQGVKKRTKTHHITKDMADAMQEQEAVNSELGLYEMIQNGKIPQ